MAGVLIVDGESFAIPDEDDWELGELAEFGRLREQWGEMGATIALVWIVKHRADPTFTVEQAQRIKVGQVDEREGSDDADPLEIPAPLGNGGSDTSSESSSGASVTLEGSGVQ